MNARTQQDIGARIHNLPASLLSSAYDEQEWQRIRSIFASAFIPSKLIMVRRVLKDCLSMYVCTFAIYLHLLQMSPLLEENHDTMLEIFGEAAVSKESIDVWRLVELKEAQ